MAVQYITPLAKAPENILPVIMGKHQNVIRMANFMKFHLVISYHIFFLAEMTHKELLAFFASGAKGVHTEFKGLLGQLSLYKCVLWPKFSIYHKFEILIVSK